MFDVNYKQELLNQGEEMERIKGMVRDKACRGRVWDENPDGERYISIIC